MNTANQTLLESTLNEIAPVLLPPADYPPTSIVKDTPRDEMVERIKANAAKANLTLTDEHWDVIHFLFDLYTHCCEDTPGSYLNQMAYWKKIDDQVAQDKADNKADLPCRYGSLTVNQSLRAYNVFRLLTRAYKEQGGKKYLYKLFPLGPVFTIHLLAQLPRLRDDVDPHFGTAF